jgi:hypothetical protein
MTANVTGVGNVFKLRVGSPAGSVPEPVTNLTRHASDGLVSPDGKWLVYGTRQDQQTGLRIRDLESGEERWLAYPVQRDDQESRASRDVYPGMSFTPDSKFLVATWSGKIWKVPVTGTAAPTQIPFSVDVEQHLGPEVKFEYPVSDSATFTVRQIRNAVPSPDGKKLAFTGSTVCTSWTSASGNAMTPRSCDDAGYQFQPRGRLMGRRSLTHRGVKPRWAHLEDLGERRAPISSRLQRPSSSSRCFRWTDSASSRCAAVRPRSQKRRRKGATTLFGSQRLEGQLL